MLAALAACVGHVGGPVKPADYVGVSIPVLVIRGGDDQVFAGADATVAAIPGAKLVTIPNRDHLTLVPDQRFKDAVLAFLRQR